MARVLALSGDLLFGSRVQGALAAAGHDVQLVGDEPRLLQALEGSGDPVGGGVDVLIVDLTDSALEGASIVESLRAGGQLGAARTLGFYSHVEIATRERAEAAGFDLVVPRSRMAREGAELIDGLLRG